MTESPTGRYTALGWDDGWAAVFAAFKGTPGRVARVDRGWLRVLTADGELTVTQPVGGPATVTGDWVACARAEGQVHVEAAAPRRTELVRRDPAENIARPQVLAANMDEVWIVHPMDRPLRTGWLDRALVVAHGSGALPLLVITKCDLADPGSLVREIRDLAPGVAVVATSSTGDRGVGGLKGRLGDGRCAVLLGRSGAGKSSLVNALATDQLHLTAAVRTGDAKGRHTTTRRSLTRAGGGTVIDTPGVRALGLWHLEQGLALAFPDIHQLGDHCRFGDCTHRHEPGCAVLAARDHGEVSAQRYERYITLSS